MNYSRAIKLLYRVENPEVVQMFGGNTDKLERELERNGSSQVQDCGFHAAIFQIQEGRNENAEFLLRAYPDLQIAYLDEEPAGRGEEPRLYSALIDTVTGNHGKWHEASQVQGSALRQPYSW